MTQEEALLMISRLFEEPPGRLSPETLRDEIPAWDSLGVLTLMSTLDSEFGIQVEDTEIQSMKTVDDILQVLKKHGKLCG
jgi:acyl carrier protein